MVSRSATSVRRSLGLLVAAATLGLSLLVSTPLGEVADAAPAQEAGECVTATVAEHAAAGRVWTFSVFGFTNHFVGFTWSTITMRRNANGTWDHIFTPC